MKHTYLQEACEMTIIRGNCIMCIAMSSVQVSLTMVLMRFKYFMIASCMSSAEDNAVEGEL